MLQTEEINEGQEMRTGYKQYFITCEHDNMICGSYESVVGGRVSTLKNAKTIINHIKNDSGTFINPHNFKVYDSYADLDIETNHVPCVYEVE